MTQTVCHGYKALYHKTYRLLYCEDITSHFDRMVASLQHANIPCDVVRARDSEEAKTILENAKERFDLLLVDSMIGPRYLGDQSDLNAYIRTMAENRLAGVDFLIDNHTLITLAAKCVRIISYHVTEEEVLDRCAARGTRLPSGLVISKRKDDVVEKICDALYRKKFNN